MRLFLQLLSYALFERPENWALEQLLLSADASTPLNRKTGWFFAFIHLKNIKVHIEKDDAVDSVDVILFDAFCLNGFLDPSSAFCVLPPSHSTLGDFSRLQSHYSDWIGDEVKDWKKNVQFLVNEMKSIGIREIKEERIYDIISKLESNCFGIWSNDNQCGRGS
jgi:hypothetical protein